jgi:RimJ/RimL family protein N-acetyltransferase
VTRVTAPEANDQSDPVRLVGRRVFLRPVLPSDYETILTAELSEDLGPRWRHGGNTPGMEAFVRSLWTGVLAQFLVCSRRTGQALGLVSLYNANLQNGYAYFAMAKFQRRTPGRLQLEGAALFLDYVFDAWPLRKVYGEVLGFNFDQFASEAGKLFVEEGRLTDHAYFGGRYWDQHVLALYRETWKERGARFAALVRDRDRS